MGDYPGSLDDFTKAIEQDPNYTFAYRNRGKSGIKLNRNDDACHDFQKTKALGDEEASELFKEYCSK